MNKVLVAVLAVALLFVAAEGLNCYSCSVGILGKCFISSSQTCGSTQNSCFKGQAAFNLTGALNFYTSGCINSTNCVTSTGTILGVGYTVTQTCCSTDLCNGASSVRLPLTAAVGAALLATTWSFM
ncbi:lymphocyte antigen-6, epidermis [Colossoma macropomum]|uniref:lymphocyte antigen-6, epidermis n=1 Tax=Colossoma macropomum TaxID=42526 RepID=UPI0018653FE4|nr:lymphocyte antigen-6, epidermis [Colossoma macropomum]